MRGVAGVADKTPQPKPMDPEGLGPKSRASLTLPI